MKRSAVIRLIGIGLVAVTAGAACADAESNERVSQGASAQTPSKSPPLNNIPERLPGESAEDYINRFNKQLEAEQKAEEAIRARQKKAIEDDQKQIDERLKKDRAKLLEVARSVIKDKDKLQSYEDRLDDAIEGNKTKELDKVIDEILAVIRSSITESELAKEVDELIKKRDELRAKIAKAVKDRSEQMDRASMGPDNTGGAVIGIQIGDLLGLSEEKPYQIELSKVIDKLNDLLSKYNPKVDLFNEVQDSVYETMRQQLVHDKLVELLKIIDDTLAIDPKDPTTLKRREQFIRELELNRLSPEERAKAADATKEQKK